MRLDQFLKWSRVVPRRSVAKATCDAGHVSVNGNVARPGRDMQVDDVVDILLPHRCLKFRIRSLPARAPGKGASGEMIEILDNQRRDTDP